MDGDTHLITEQRDSFGRSTGFAYSKNGSVQHTITTGYGADGRISIAGFTHSGEVKQFGYEYLSGTNLLHKLTKPNNMTLTQTYESTRDLLTGMAYHRGSTLVAQRTYSYDILGRPTARNTARNGQTVNDTFAHNTRSELTAATVNGADYEYAYDNIGNRQQSTEGNDVTLYDANALNQYTSISENGADAFVPQFDADGNQTLIQTDTGIWSAVYNAENRPVTFTYSESNTVVECQYDSMGRRAFKKVTVNGSVTLHQRYIYREYLQIACIDLTRSNHPALWFITWDPTQPIATRPLAIQISGTWHTYGWDLTKNICEVYDTSGYIRTTYTYSPYGDVSTSGNVTQPIQWSSEYYDVELGLVYYNYRHYNTKEGRWLNRDKGKTTIPKNLYRMVDNSPIMYYDLLGNDKSSIADEIEAKRAMHKDPRFSVMGQRLWAIIRVHYEDDTLGFCDSVKSSYAYSRKHVLNYDTAMEAFRNEIGNRASKYYKDFIENRVAGNFVDYYTKMQIVKDASLGLYNVDGELKDKSSFNITLNWGLGKTISAKFESLIYASNNNSNIAHYLSQLDFYEAQKVLFKKPEIGFDDMASVALSIGYDYSRQLENNHKLKFNCGVNAGSDATGRENVGVNASVIYEMGETWHIHASGSLNWNENFLPNVNAGLRGNF